MLKNKTYTLFITLLFSCLITYLFTFTGKNLDYVLPRRGYKIWSMLLISTATAYSSIVFQTISSNRILTPSIIGFDSFFVLIQTIIVFVYGDKSFQAISQGSNYLLSVGLMLIFAIIMYFLIFKKESRNIYILMLIGLILGTVFRSISSFISILLDPNEFSFVQASMFASFENLQTDLLGISTVLIMITVIVGSLSFPQLDVINLGRENAISLGVDYNKVVRNNLLLISIMVAVSTALVGPITFLGLIVSNLTYEIFKGKTHRQLIIGCSLLTSVVLIGGQYLIEHLFNFSTTVSIVINFVGGIYFIYILLKSNKK